MDEEQVGDISILTVVGELDARTLPDAHEKLASLLKVLRVHLVFDLSGMEIVTSTGVSFLIDAAKRTRELGGDAVLSHPTRLLQGTLKSLKIADYFKVFPTSKEAVWYFRDRELDDTQVPEAPAPRRGWLSRLWRRRST
ncbi:MAG: STAS domain-containing protein [Planctomycetota bacterium]|jgi:anti-sigma B factor antagonist